MVGDLCHSPERGRVFKIAVVCCNSLMSVLPSEHCLG